MESRLEDKEESSWTPGWFSWTKQSMAALRSVEKQILSYLKASYKRFYVDIGPVVSQSDKIWTISLNDESPKIPLVMLHGLASGVALWCVNLDSFAENRPVYAIDVLGFGRSSRPTFSTDASKAEEQFVDSVEEWRREMNLQKFILLGHSLGGFIGTSYALKYPDRVSHLILADPWGFPERPENLQEKYQMPFWVRAAFYALQPLNPLWALRAAGPAGQWLVGKTRPDLVRKYAVYLPEAETLIPAYVHQCNAQTPSGETAFHSMMESYGWAKNPMVKRIDRLDPKVPITVIYGSRSWVDNASGEVLKQKRPQGSYTNIQMIKGAGHHIYLDKPEQFNKCVLQACSYTDKLNASDATKSDKPSDIVSEGDRLNNADERAK